MNTPRPMTLETTTNGRVRDTLANEGERTYATFNHLAGLIGVFDVSSIITTIVVIVMWQIRAKDSPFLDDHGREAANFQLTLLAYGLLGLALILLSFGILGFLAPVGIVVIRVLLLVGCIRGAIAANRGEYYRYPATIRFIDPPAA